MKAFNLCSSSNKIFILLFSLAKFKALLISLLFVFCLTIAVFFLKQKGYGITYTNSVSMPSGFYLQIPANSIERNDIVVFNPPSEIKRFLLEHRWGARSGLLLKRVMGIPGDTVCNHDAAIWINEQKIAPIYENYAPNQKLPQKNFCGQLTKNQYILLSIKIERSFDSRYFGPIDKKNILGKAIKL